MITEQALEMLLLVGGLWVKKRALQAPWWGRALRRVLAAAFHGIGHIIFDVKVRGLEHFSNRPSTLIVTNHKSDFDIILLAPILYWAHRGTGPISRLAFVAAERMFQPSYFSMYLLPQPQWLSRLLYPANLSAVLKALRAYPIPHVKDRKLGAHLRDLQTLAGNLYLRTIFRENPQTFFPNIPTNACIRDALRWVNRQVLDTEYEFSIFTPELEKQLRERHLHKIFSCLSRFAAILDQGDDVFLAPEGDLSQDGGFGEIKAALPRLIKMADGDIVALPVNFTYDFMTTERPTAFLSIGKELREVRGWSKEQIKTDIKQAILTQGTVTLGQIVAHLLQQQAKSNVRELSIESLKEAVHERAQQFVIQGFTVDERLLSASSFERRWRAFMEFCQQKHFIQLHADRLLLNPDQLLYLDTSLKRSTPWLYQANELESFLKAIPY